MGLITTGCRGHQATVGSFRQPAQDVCQQRRIDERHPGEGVEQLSVRECHGLILPVLRGVDARRRRLLTNNAERLGFQNPTCMEEGPGCPASPWVWRPARGYRPPFGTDAQADGQPSVEASEQGGNRVLACFPAHRLRVWLATLRSPSRVRPVAIRVVLHPPRDQADTRT